MSQLNEKSRYGKNLLLQFLLSAVFSGVTASVRPPLNMAFGAIAALLNWSVTIGVLYGIGRWFGLRIDFLEAYYQQVPTGFDREKLRALPRTAAGPDTQLPDIRALSGGDPRAGASGYRPSEERSFDWEKLLSVEYIRYAGLILIITSIFAFLFKIEWSLACKIGASFIAAALGIIGAEVLTRRTKPVLAGALFLIGFAFAQFGTTLLFKYFQLQQDTGLLGSGNFWLVAKILLTAAAALGLLRYRASFVPTVFFVVAYLTPVSLMQVLDVLSTEAGLVFVVAISMLALVFAVSLDRWGIALVNVILANTYAISFMQPVQEQWQSLYGGVPTEELSVIVSRNMHSFLAVAILFMLHGAAGTVHALRRSRGTNAAAARQADGLEIVELALAHVYGLSSLVSIQANIPRLQGYYGVTLLAASTFTFVMFLVVRSRPVSSRYAEVMLNLALAISVVGMFVNTRGTWTAIVFLLFSCLLIYVSFAMGTLRTRGYAFAALTVSMIKLYFECFELFDSISGTAMVLIIGVVLMVLSFKLENIKSLIGKRHSGGGAPMPSGDAG